MSQESFRRWQAEAIKQKQTASALLLALSGATLAFSVSQLTGKPTYIGFWQSLAFHTTAITHLFSMTMGVLFSLNRIRDFDLTAMIARVRESEPKAPRLKNMRNTVRRWGRITRGLFLAQALSFVLGMTFFVWFVLTRYRCFLYPPS
jgi:hypothetical protein